MPRTYLRRYKALSGPHAGTISDGFEIGSQDYLGQYEKLGMTPEQVFKHRDAALASGRWDGVWLNDVNAALHRPTPIQGVRPPSTEITDEGVNYDDVYLDLCTPFDRFGKEISVGDMVYVAVKNEVLPCIVKKIANPSYHPDYGRYLRKITVQPDEGGPSKTISSPYAMVKVDK